MSVHLFLNGQKVSRKNIANIVAKKQLDAFIEDAKHMYIIDPLISADYFISGYGMLTIKFA